ncbi:MAG TPA: A24 family peptidase, partial [Hyphomicrobiales bacterium]|nr:A24 family peptidase [Hyphomicrobiales bacterium]
MTLSSIPLLLLLLWALACALQDARARRIGNPLLLAGALAALLHLLYFGYSMTRASPMSVTTACVLALILTVPGYRRGKLGAGDVKLLLVIALATSPMPLLLTVSLGALCCAAWFAAAPSLWPRLPSR